MSSNAHNSHLLPRVERVGQVVGLPSIYNANHPLASQLKHYWTSQGKLAKQKDKYARMELKSEICANRKNRKILVNSNLVTAQEWQASGIKQSRAIADGIRQYKKKNADGNLPALKALKREAKGRDASVTIENLKERNMRIGRYHNQLRGERNSLEVQLAELKATATAMETSFDNEKKTQEELRQHTERIIQNTVALKIRHEEAEKINKSYRQICDEVKGKLLFYESNINRLLKVTDIQEQKKEEYLDEIVEVKLKEEEEKRREKHTTSEHYKDKKDRKDDITALQCLLSENSAWVDSVRMRMQALDHRHYLALEERRCRSGPQNHGTNSHMSISARSGSSTPTSYSLVSLRQQVVEQVRHACTFLCRNFHVHNIDDLLRQVARAMEVRNILQQQRLQQERIVSNTLVRHRQVSHTKKVSLLDNTVPRMIINVTQLKHMLRKVIERQKMSEKKYYDRMTHLVKLAPIIAIIRCLIHATRQTSTKGGSIPAPPPPTTAKEIDTISIRQVQTDFYDVVNGVTEMFEKIENREDLIVEACLEEETRPNAVVIVEGISKHSLAYHQYLTLLHKTDKDALGSQVPDKQNRQPKLNFPGGKKAGREQVKNHAEYMSREMVKEESGTIVKSHTPHGRYGLEGESEQKKSAAAAAARLYQPNRDMLLKW